jgi:sn-glycerol 3-phosphate transport system ATP-binding protein
MTLAQRMIVMNAGRIEQIGTPEEVYLRPQTTFVAGFIGSPPMNLLEGRADGSRFTIGGTTLPLPASAPRAGALVLGTRPEHLEVDAAGTWSMTIEMQEMLGAERLLHGHVGEASCTVRVPGTLAVARNGDTLRLRAAPEHLHWFDPASGKRVG